jgi:putative ABC transport system permease protein
MGALAPYAALLGAVLLVIGALLLVPMVLAGLARAATAAPVALRMAFRDASRQRGRATSTVAAILGVTSVLGAVLIIAASDTAYRGRTYVPQAADGQGTISAAIHPGRRAPASTARRSSA